MTTRPEARYYARLLTQDGPRWHRWDGAAVGQSDPDPRAADLQGESLPPGWTLISAAPWEPHEAVTDLRAAPLRGLLAPVTPTKIIGIGSNYRDHAREMGKPVPTAPKIFLKPPSSLIGSGAAIRIPPGTARVDHEAELGVIIGRRCSRVTAAEAMAYVCGYTVVNDVTARDFQAADGVFARAKGFDTFCPAGPYLVTGINKADGSALAVRACVNGAIRQDGNTRDMVFDMATLIAYVSQIMTLEPGDLISTGTPAGVGPLVNGDIVAVEVEGVGILENTVVDRDDR